MLASVLRSFVVPPARSFFRGRAGAFFVASMAALALATMPARARADEWFGPDKALHFGVSAGIAGAAFARLSVATSGAPFLMLTNTADSSRLLFRSNSGT